MTSFEWLTIAYLAAVVNIGWRHRAPGRMRGALYAAATAVLALVAGHVAPWSLRAWLPNAYLVIGYWLPALFTRVPPVMTFEKWLVAADAALLGGRTLRPPGRWLAHWLELAYLCCYPMVPAGCAVVFTRGTAQQVSRFWLAVLIAGFACYVTLPWTASRPPRLVGNEIAGRGLARVNAHVLGRLSHQLTTFPSGHVAVSVAVALSVWSVAPQAGAVFGLVAAGVAMAAVTGRYHYLVDVLAGVPVGVAAWAVVGAVTAAPAPAWR